MIEKGDILICKKDCYCNNNYNIKGRSYTVKNVIVNGDRNTNIYVSTDYIGGVGVSTPFSLYSDYDKYKSYSKYVLHDHFVSLVEVREEKLKQLGL